MGIKTKDPVNEFKEKIPGPGQYDVLAKRHSRIKNEPAFSMGSALRPDLTNLKDK